MNIHGQYEYPFIPISPLNKPYPPPQKKKKKNSAWEARVIEGLKTTFF